MIFRSSIVKSIIFCIAILAIIVLLLIIDETSAETITVDDSGGADYDKIQDAIDNAFEHDIIRVYEGKYMENVVIDKTLILIGNGTENTTIDANGNGIVVKIIADNVELSKLFITGSGDYTLDSDAGIQIYSSNNIISKCNISKNNYYSILIYYNINNNTISNCNILNNKGNIEIYYSNNNNISNCNISNNDDVGIYLFNSSNNLISECNISNNSKEGIWMWHSSDNNTITNSNITNNRDVGFRFLDSGNNLILNCSISTNDVGGIWLEDSTNNIIHNNSFFNNGILIYGETLSNYIHSIENNIINNMSLFYYKNKQNIILNGIKVGQLILIDCSNFEIQNVNISNIEVGIEIAFCENNKISRCNLSKNKKNGILLKYSNKIIISSCNISRNNIGISFFQSNNNIISECNYSNNEENGILFEESSNNTISNCLIIYTEQKDGVYLSYLSNNNTISNCKMLSNDDDGIRFFDSSNNEIINCNISNNFKNGIAFLRSSYNIIKSCKIINNDDNGIHLSDLSDNNIIRKCTILNHNINGITLYSGNNHVTNCTISYNGGGILFRYYGSNDISNCSILNNTWNGIYIWSTSDDNIIFHNNLIGNNLNARDKGSNLWDNGKEGNYWSDYTGEDPDEDGIGNSPYFIEGGANKDNFPLMILIEIENERPIVDFDFFPKNPSDLDEIEFTANSIDLDGEIVSWYWEFGDGVTSEQQNPKHKYEDNGIYEVNLTVMDDSKGNNRTTLIILVTNVIPKVNFTSSIENPTTADFLEFLDYSNDPDGTIISWFWEFGDKNTSNEINPKHQFSNNGTYLINLTVTDNDNDSNTSSIEIIVLNLPPEANFSYTPLNPTISNEIQFSDESIDSDGNIVSWLWDFGDLNTSDEKNPKHQYSIPGAYKINLTIEDDDGAKDILTKSINIDNIDNEPPEDPTFSPANGEKVNKKKPTITITFSEEVIISEAKLNEIDIKTDLESGDNIIFTYTPNNELSEGDNIISIKAKDLNDNEMSESATSTFTIEIVPIDETSPEITEVAETGISQNSTYITWTTDEPSTSQIKYGITDSYGYTTDKDTNLVTSHNVSISNLEPNKTYHYRVISIDEFGNENISDDYIFKTLEKPGEPPVIEVINIEVKLEIADNEIKENDEVIIKASVTNKGTTSIEVVVVFTDNDKKIGEEKITIEPGKSKTSSINWTAQSGNHTIKVVVKSDGKEVSNGTASKKIEVTEGDIGESGFNMILLVPIIIIPIVVVIGLIMRNRNGEIKQQIPTQQNVPQQTFQTQQQPQTQQIQKSESSAQQTQQQAFKKCPYCNAQVPGQFKFCNMCGKEMEIRQQQVPNAEPGFNLCPYCNAQVPGQFKFCNMCGKEIK